MLPASFLDTRRCLMKRRKPSTDRLGVYCTANLPRDKYQQTERTLNYVNSMHVHYTTVKWCRCRIVGDEMEGDTSWISISLIYVSGVNQPVQCSRRLGVGWRGVGVGVGGLVRGGGKVGGRGGWPKVADHHQGVKGKSVLPKCQLKYLVPNLRANNEK